MNRLTHNPQHTTQQSLGDTLREQLPSLPTTTTGTGAAASTASILSPACVFDTINRGLEAAAEAVGLGGGGGPNAAPSTETETSALSPAGLAEAVNKGLEQGGETARAAVRGALGAMPTLPSLPGPAQAAEAVNRGIEEGGLAITAPVEAAKGLVPSTPFPTPTASASTMTTTGPPSALSPAGLAEAVNKGLEQGGEAVQGGVQTAKAAVRSTVGGLPTLPSLPGPAQAAEAINKGIEQGGAGVQKAAATVGGAFSALPTLFPSPARAAEAVNKAIDTGAPGQGTSETGGAGFGAAAYDQQARVRFFRVLRRQCLVGMGLIERRHVTKQNKTPHAQEAAARQLLEEAEAAAAMGAVPAGAETRQRQPRMPQASLFGAVGTFYVRKVFYKSLGCIYMPARSLSRCTVPTD